jgi:uncharacterized membrane protein YjjP (DUF1212 family)
MLPEKKVTAATLAAAITTIVVWILHSAAHVDIPPEVSAAIATVLVGVAGYLAPHTNRPDLAPAAPATPAAPTTTTPTPPPAAPPKN